MELTFCAICGATVEVGTIRCPHCLSELPAEASALAVSGAVKAGGQARYRARLLLLGSDVVAGLALVLLVMGLIVSAGRQPTLPGQAAPQFVAPIIIYPTSSQVTGTPSVAPRAPSPTPTAAPHQPSSGSGPAATPTPSPTAPPPPPPPPPPPTPTPIPPAPTPTPTVGQFQ